MDQNMSCSWKKGDQFSIEEEEEEQFLCNYCDKYITTKLVFLRHLPKCRRRHKSKNLLICFVDSSHHMAKHEYEEHVKDCMKKNRIEKSIEDFRRELIKAGLTPEETLDCPTTKTLSLPNELKIKAFEAPRQRNFETIWGLDKQQKLEWERADRQRIRNILDGKPYDDIEYPRANGSYVTASEIISKIRYGFIVSAKKPMQASPTKKSIEENSNKNANSKSSIPKVSEQKTKKKNKAAAYEITDIWSDLRTSDTNNCRSGEQSEARKNKNRKNEFTKEATGLNITFNVKNNKLPDINCTSGEQSGARKKTKNRNHNYFTKEMVDANKTSSELQEALIEKQNSSKYPGSRNKVQENWTERPVHICDKASNFQEKRNRNVNTVSVNPHKGIPNDPCSARKTNLKNDNIKKEEVNDPSSARKTNLKTCNIKNGKTSSKHTNSEYSEPGNSVQQKKKSRKKQKREV